MFRHVLRNKAGFSGNNYFVKKMVKIGPRNSEKGGTTCGETYSLRQVLVETIISITASAKNT